MYSYSSMRSGVGERMREFSHLYRIHMHDTPAATRDFLTNAAEIEQLVQERTGLSLRGLDMLDVGCGQQLKLAQYFALRQNDVTGIDYNVVPFGFDALGYWKLMRMNGPMRLVKTLGRKALRIDARFSRYLVRQMADAKAGSITTLQMDAERMSFVDGRFEFIYSRSVMEHLERPGRALKEINRVLKPGGVAHLGAHLYTCDSGAHDPRVLSGKRDGVPLWAHLRPDHAGGVRPNSYLNRYRLRDWQRLFAEMLPGAHVHLHQRGRAALEPQLGQLRAAGELADYSDDELFTDEVVAVWRKHWN